VYPLCSAPSIDASAGKSARTVYPPQAGLSPAINRASFGASGRDLDAQANPKGSWHRRLLLVPFSSTWKKMNKFKKLSRKMTESLRAFH
jgi:hypothetical protein